MGYFIGFYSQAGKGSKVLKVIKSVISCKPNVSKTVTKIHIKCALIQNIMDKTYLSKIVVRLNR